MREKNINQNFLNKKFINIRNSKNYPSPKRKLRNSIYITSL